MNKNNIKVDSEGNYLNFSGLTIISYVDHTNIIYSKLFDLLSSNKQITEKYAVLPIDSYHMTIVSIVDQRNFPNIDLYINTHEVELNQIIANLNNLFTNTIQAKIIDIIVENVISIYLELNEDTLNVIKLLTEKLKVDCVDYKIPKHFHITLAYAYKPVASTEQNQIKNMLENNIMLNEYVHLHIPKLCKYNDMTKFIEFNRLT